MLGSSFSNAFHSPFSFSLPLSLCQMAALGVFLHKGSYFRSVFNMCDFFVTITTAVPLIYYVQSSDTYVTILMISQVVGGKGVDGVTPPISCLV